MHLAKSVLWPPRVVSGAVCFADPTLLGSANTVIAAIDHAMLVVRNVRLTVAAAATVEFWFLAVVHFGLLVHNMIASDKSFLVQILLEKYRHSPHPHRFDGSHFRIGNLDPARIRIRRSRSSGVMVSGFISELPAPLFPK